SSGGHVLIALAARAERVVVDAGDGVGGSRARDVEDVVLVGESRQLNGDAGHHGPGDDADSFAHQVGGLADGRLGVATVVGDDELDRPAVDGSASVSGVGESGLESGQILLAVTLEWAGGGGDDPNLDRISAGLGGLGGVGGRLG